MSGYNNTQPMISNVCAEDYQEFVTTTAKKQQGRILKL